MYTPRAALRAARYQRSAIRYQTSDIAIQLMALLEEHHRARLRERAGLHPIEVHPTGQAAPVEVHLVGARGLPFIDQHGDFSSQQIIHGELYITDTWHLEPDTCFRIKRIRIILLQRVSARKQFLFGY